MARRCESIGSICTKSPTCRSIAAAKSRGIVNATDPPAFRSFRVRAMCYFRVSSKAHADIVLMCRISQGFAPCGPRLPWAFQSCDGDDFGTQRPPRKATPSGTCPLTPGPCGPALYLLRTKNAISPQLFGLRRRSPPSSPMPVRPGGPLPLSGTDVLLLLRHRRPGCQAAAWQADHLHAV